jgi:cardiolipin synthase
VLRPHIISTCLLLLVLFGCARGSLISLNNRPTDQPYRLTNVNAIGDPEFRQTMANLLGPPIVEGNAVQTLLNGDQIFPAMLEAIGAATKTVTFESYIYWEGMIAQEFTAALCDRAKSGVKVHVILDSLGAGKIDQQYLKRMKDCGVEYVMYHGLHWYDILATQRINNRTHRKLLVVDGTIGFTGGVGVADEWMGNADSPTHWRDTHYRIEGPAVAQLQAAFADNWMETTGHVLVGGDYFPVEQKKPGDIAAQVFKSSSDSGSESMELMYLLSMSAARKNIRLATAYFVPDKLTIKTLLEARERGVSVQIIVPGGKIDEKIVRRASRARWGEMLQAGIEIYEYQPTMFHCKQMIVDDQWVSIGSANLDNRSFRLNDEANLNVLNAKFAQEQIKVFEEDLSKSKRISYEQWKHRPLGEQLIEGFSTLCGPWM